MVGLRRAAVDDDVRNAAFCREERERRRRIDRQSRTERDHKVGAHRPLLRAFERLRLETLPEADRRRFEKTSADTKRRSAMEPKKIEVRARIAPGPATHTF